MHDAPEDQLASPAARRFLGALRAVEDHGDLATMVGVGGDATRWWGVGGGAEEYGPDGGRRFWETYRRTYADITTTFTAVLETGDRVVLEWVSTGHHHNGTRVRYHGVTVLEIVGADGDQDVAAVRLYFDTAAAASSASARDHREPDGDPMLDPETRASGRNSGLAPRDGADSA